MENLARRFDDAFIRRARRSELQSALQRTQDECRELRGTLQEIRAERTALQAASRDQRVKHEVREARLQKWQIFTSIATAATVIVAVVAIALSYDSLRQQENSAASQDQESRYSSIYQLYLDVDKEIADHPRLTPCFRDTNCPSTLTATERNQAYSLAVYVVDFYQYMYDQLIDIGYAPSPPVFVLRNDVTMGATENWITWSQTVFYGFKYSTMECQALFDGSAAYSKNFVHAVAVTGVCPSLPDPEA